MIAFKGFTPDIRSVLGNGIKEKCCFSEGITMEETESKTGRSGYHCCENPFECLKYYSFNGKNRFFMVEAKGDIDEDAAERIACTKITLLEELTPIRFALEGMKYMIMHMDRTKWQQDYGTVTVLPDEAESKDKGYIAIARGRSPRVRGKLGSILGLLAEDEKGWPINAKVFEIKTKEAENKWFHLNSEGEIEVET